MSCPFTIDPRIATPATAPSSRLVLTAEEAIPEFAAGRLESAVAFTGTMTMPKPIPARPIVQPSVDTSTPGPMAAYVRSTPDPARRQPTVMGIREPIRPTQRPVKSDATTMPPSKGRKSSAKP